MIKDKDTLRFIHKFQFQAINKRLTMKKSVSFDNVLTRTKLELDEDISKSSTTLKKPDVESRKKSLIERRMSKSLYLKIDYPKELPIIRQNSVPKFFLDTPEQNQTESTLIKSPLTSLQSPMVGTEHSFDLYSVVQMEKIKTQTVKRILLRFTGLTHEEKKDIQTIILAHLDADRKFMLQTLAKLKLVQNFLASLHLDTNLYQLGHMSGTTKVSVWHDILSWTG
ncbi:hypothetical protein NQ317_014983 [Molorchus minor]|uniref:Uncharacterized protein n=1 Tax=Molorchus minor TaxID=1323400 RepID=A0ABQ9J0M0_9CUCU|nr:hypothetical protein NQ317_014983 [Molorchus minor]